MTRPKTKYKNTALNFINLTGHKDEMFDMSSPVSVLNVCPFISIFSDSKDSSHKYY